MNDSSTNNYHEINDNNIEEYDEENNYSDQEDEDEDENNYNKQNILLCPNKYCNSIPEIYLDENSTSVYLFCKNNKNKEKHKYLIPIKKYLSDNTSMSFSKLKDEEEKKLQEINKKLPDELNQEIEDIKNKIKCQKKYLENLTNIFNSLIKRIVDNYTSLLDNKLSIFSLQRKIIYTFLKHHKDKNAIKNFKNLSNFIQNVPNNTFFNNDENNAYNKNFIDDNNEDSNDINNNNAHINIKNVLDKIKNLTKIFNYFNNTSHNLMTINKCKGNFNMNGINNLCILKNGNLCFSSDLGTINIYTYDKKINNFELVNKLTPSKNNLINYVTQLSNELLICCSKTLIIGKLLNNDKEFEIYQKINEFGNFNIVKVIELANEYLVTYDRGFQISIFKPIISTEDKTLIEYQLIYNKINKGEQIYSLLSLPLNKFNSNDIQYISTSNTYSTCGNSCLRFYSSKNNYQNFDTIYGLNCSRYVDSLLMINDTILCLGIQESSLLSQLNGIALVDINLRQIVTFIEEDYPTSFYKLNNDLIVVAFNKSSSNDIELIPGKKINFYYIDDTNKNNNNELIYINSINSGIKNFIYSLGELDNLGELIIVGNQDTKVFQ